MNEYIKDIYAVFLARHNNVKSVRWDKNGYLVRFYMSPVDASGNYHRDYELKIWMWPEYYNSEHNIHTAIHQA